METQSLKPITVLFVCTGNIFRSMSAEYCLRDYLIKNHLTSMSAASAGTVANPEQAHPTVRRVLHNLGIDIDGHHQRKLSQEIISSSDVIVALAEYHRQFIRENFGITVPLFNELTMGTSTSVWDVNDAISDYVTNTAAVDQHIEKTIFYLYDAIPKLYQSIVNNRIQLSKQDITLISRERKP